MKDKFSTFTIGSFFFISGSFLIAAICFTLIFSNLFLGESTSMKYLFLGVLSAFICYKATKMLQVELRLKQQ